MHRSVRTACLSAQFSARSRNGTDFNAGYEGVGPGGHGVAVVGLQQSIDHSSVFGSTSKNYASKIENNGVFTPCLFEKINGVGRGL